MFFENLEKLELFGNPIVNFADMGELLLRFAINILFVFIIVRLIFYPLYRQKNYLFTFFIVNISVFLVCFILSSIKLRIGFAFGLFAVFSIIRYRTEPIPIKEMTYLFIVIIAAVINSLSAKKISYSEVILCNAIITAGIFILEKSWMQKRDLVKEIRYERIELVKPEKYDEMLKDLKDRTGLDITRADVDSINFLNDTANIKVYYTERGADKS